MRLVIRERTNAVEILLIRTLGGSGLPWAGPRNPTILEKLRRTQTSDETPEWRYLYLQQLGLAWIKLNIICALLLLPLVFYSQDAGDSVLTFVTIFCIVGGVDASWRALIAWVAMRRTDAADGRVDDRARHLLRITRVYDATLSSTSTCDHPRVATRLSALTRDRGDSRSPRGRWRTLAQSATAVGANNYAVVGADAGGKIAFE